MLCLQCQSLRGFSFAVSPVVNGLDAGEAVIFGGEQTSLTPPTSFKVY